LAIARVVRIIRVPRLRAFARPVGREALAFAALAVALLLASTLPLVGPAVIAPVVAVVVEPAALGAARMIALVLPLAVPPRIAMAAAILVARLRLPAFLVSSPALVVTFHVAISFSITLVRVFACVDRRRQQGSCHGGVAARSNRQQQ